ncbi:MAG TPA: amidohydrolase family protein [Spirochaetia bacterium]|nr:amidohydrolase family protein [Spirochaetia bacterium]
MKGIRERLQAELEKIIIVDTHEHIMPEAARQMCAVDFSYLFGHYNTSDLISAGMPPGLLEAVRLPIHRYRVAYNERIRPQRILAKPDREDMTLEEKWQAVEPYWEAIRNTAYARWTLIAVRDLFGCEDLNRDTWKKLSEAVAGSRKPGWYSQVLKEKAGIQCSIVDISTPEVDRTLMAPVMRVDAFVAPRSRQDIAFLENESGEAIHGLKDLVRAFHESISRYIDRGIIGLKSALAYMRTLRYDKVTFHEAEEVFNRLFLHLGEGPSWLEVKPLQDYMMHQAVRAAVDNNLPFQIHTGLQEGNENIITNSKPTHLINLLVEYREAKFDLFHGGYPYVHEWVTLAKNFPNVYPDLCWMYIISPHISRQLLHELIETVPANKILGFGGDSITVEGAYAHSRMARAVLSDVLTEKVSEGYLSEDQALDLAVRFLRDNPASLYGLTV